MAFQDPSEAENLEDTECVVAALDAVNPCPNISVQAWVEGYNKDENLELVNDYIVKGWPETRKLSNELKAFATIAPELSRINGMIMR